MGYVKIKVIEKGTCHDLQYWKDHMLEKAKCWNKFCLEIYGDHELQAVRVVKEGNPDEIFLTTLCEDCIKNEYGPLVNDSHLMVEIPKKNRF